MNPQMQKGSDPGPIDRCWARRHFNDADGTPCDSLDVEPVLGLCPKHDVELVPVDEARVVGTVAA